MQVLTRSLRTALSARGARQMGSGGHKAHVHMPETAMLTNNVRLARFLVGSDVFKDTHKNTLVKGKKTE